MAVTRRPGERSPKPVSRVAAGAVGRALGLGLEEAEQLWLLDAPSVGNQPQVAWQLLHPPAPTRGMSSLILTPALSALSPTLLSSVHSTFFSGMLEHLAIEGLKPKLHPACFNEKILSESQLEAFDAFFLMGIFPMCGKLLERHDSAADIFLQPLTLCWQLSRIPYLFCAEHPPQAVPHPNTLQKDRRDDGLLHSCR